MDDKAKLRERVQRSLGDEPGDDDPAVIHPFPREDTVSEKLRYLERIEKLQSRIDTGQDFGATTTPKIRNS